MSSKNPGKRSKDLWLGGSAAVLVVVLGLLWLSNTQSTIGSEPVPMASAQTPAKSQPVAKKSTSTAAPKSNDVASVASSLSNATQFASWFSSTGVKSSVTGAGPYTIFVPTDASVGSLPKGTITNLSATEKKRLVQYHIVSGRAIDSDAVQSGSIMSMSRDSLNFLASTDGTVRVNSSSIVGTYKATNGVVYLINAVLLPPKSSM